MLEIGISYDPRELRDFEQRIQASLRSLGDRRLFDQIAVLAEKQNRYHALRGLDRYGRNLIPWKVRSGTSDYHGKPYKHWTNQTVLIPFGNSSRRIDALLWKWDKIKKFGITTRATLTVGFSSRANRIPLYWKAQNRDVLGLPPRTRRGFSLLLSQHSSKSHGLLKRGGRAVGRIANMIGF